jgi:phosphonate transport system ATP-binding protein
MKSEIQLSIRNLVKTYPNGVQALKGISFDVHAGEFLVVIGMSGAGKSTLLRCLNRLLDTTSGEIFFHGEDIVRQRGEPVRQLRRQIGMIFQHFNLIPRHSVLSNVLMGRLGSIGFLPSVFGWFAKEDHEACRNSLALVGISDQAHMRADQLSGGQQQRVAIARALVQEPKVLLADEPVSSLDTTTGRGVMNYLKKINQELGLTVICNLHSLDLVRHYATRVIALKAGEIIFQGDPAEITETWFQKNYGDS